MRKFLVATSIVLTGLLLTPTIDHARAPEGFVVALGAVTADSTNSTCGSSTEHVMVTVNWTVTNSVTAPTNIESFKVTFKGIFSGSGPLQETKSAAASARKQQFCILNVSNLTGWEVKIDTTIKVTDTVQKTGTF